VTIKVSGKGRTFTLSPIIINIAVAWCALKKLLTQFYFYWPTFFTGHQHGRCHVLAIAKSACVSVRYTLALCQNDAS